MCLPFILPRLVMVAEDFQVLKFKKLFLRGAGKKGIDGASSDGNCTSKQQAW